MGIVRQDRSPNAIVAAPIFLGEEYAPKANRAPYLCRNECKIVNEDWWQKQKCNFCDPFLVEVPHDLVAVLPRTRSRSRAAPTQPGGDPSFHTPVSRDVELSPRNRNWAFPTASEPPYLS